MFNNPFNVKVIEFVQAVLITVLTINAFRLLWGFIKGGPHPMNVAASWFGAGPVMPDIESMSWFHAGDMAASFLSLLLICTLSVCIPCKLIDLLFYRNKKGELDHDEVEDGK